MARERHVCTLTGPPRAALVLICQQAGKAPRAKPGSSTILSSLSFLEKGTEDRYSNSFRANTLKCRGIVGAGNPGPLAWTSEISLAVLASPDFSNYEVHQGGEFSETSCAIKSLAGFVERLDANRVYPAPSSSTITWLKTISARVIDVFVDELDLRALGFEGVAPEATGRPAYHPSTMLKIYVYGYINQIQSSRRLERETARNVEMMWLTGRLTPDCKTIADFRKDNGPAIRSACRQFVTLCRNLNLVHPRDRGDRRQPVQGPRSRRAGSAVSFNRPMSTT